MKPLVSVIVPCFNQGKFLGEALDSILYQSWEIWECIIIDDGSWDNTREVASKYAAKDDRFRLISQKNRGLSGARNRGLDEAKGQYIQFLDADDLIEKQKIKLQILAINQFDRLNISYCDFRYCPEHDTTITTTRDNFLPPRFIKERPIYDIAERWESEFSIPCHCFLFDKRFFHEKNIRFDETLPNHEDWDCWMRIFAFDPQVMHIEGQHAIYRLHSTSMCVDTQKMWRGFSQAILKQLNIYRHNPIMRRILKNKYNERRLAYGIPLTYERIYQNFHKNITNILRKTPWPIQRIIRNFIQLKQGD